MPVEEFLRKLGYGSLENAGDILSQFTCFSMPCIYHHTNAVCFDYAGVVLYYNSHNALRAQQIRRKANSPPAGSPRSSISCS